MNNKKDWEELEQWQQNKREAEKEKYGFDYEKINTINQNEKVDKVVKGINVVGKTTGIIIAIVILILVFIILVNIYMIFANGKSRTDIDIIEAIEGKYQIKVKIVSQDVDERENGKYVLAVKDNEDIQFTAIKEYGSLDEDFSDRSHKYYFELWESEEKYDFIVEESEENDLLTFETYIENFDDVETATYKIINFANFCGENFDASWQIYLKNGDKRIYPYYNSGITPEEAMNYSKGLYNEYFLKE